jgi:deazaflavin-dependent oxidoreductase (nitroreductase family)
MSHRPYLRPSRAITRILNPLARTLGLASTLRVQGRKTGKIRQIPVYVLEHSGERYLVAPRGETEWVRNLRAAGSAEIKTKGRTEVFEPEEVPAEARAPIIDAYLERWGTLVRAPFEELPDPADHPVFRMRPPRAGG